MAKTIRTELTPVEKSKLDEWLPLIDAKMAFATFQNLAEMISQVHEDMEEDLIFEYLEKYMAMVTLERLGNLISQDQDDDNLVSKYVEQYWESK